MHDSKLKVLFLLLFLMVGCSGRTAEERRAYATWEAEQYPWAFYPIGEESKQELCKALALPENDVLCLERTKILHEDVVDAIRRRFPVDKTSYAEVETALGDFPHSKEESRQPNGNLVGLRYVYRITEYEGACVYFQIDLEDMETIRKIYSSGLGTAPGPTRCGPAGD
ncbi:MAG: hypothetical protein IPM53_04555 [Anaerolineaceae bacterium]|nr:hypothetical protein [Anaerolineaceae bacterium]